MFPERVDCGVTLERLDHDHVDVQTLYDLFADSPAVFEHVPQEPYDTLRDADERLAKSEEQWAEREGAVYAVRPGGVDGPLAGFTGLFFEWERETGRLGVVLGEEFWGEGHGRACLDALARVAFETCALDVVSVGYETGNERSRNLVEGFVDDHGGRKDGVLRNWTPVGDEVRDHHRYTVTAAEYADGE